mmetsp:Transcript_21768/g.25039  ORF Transcript_21768/g.25039 Transcript_21768/m.25039 type:complete len:114 (+) Transcript_21768:1461-1802(+)
MNYFLHSASMYPQRNSDFTSKQKSFLCSHGDVCEETKYFIGFIDFMGIFHCDPDPEKNNGYLPEEIDDENLLQQIMNKSRLAEWKDSILMAYHLLQSIYTANQKHEEDQCVLD